MEAKRSEQRTANSGSEKKRTANSGVDVSVRGSLGTVRSPSEARGKGFTLPEIMVVGAIVSLLAAMAIPNLLRARVNSGESIVMDSCHTVGTACQNFYTVTQPHSYPGTLQELSDAEPPYLDPYLGGGIKQGYRFIYQRLDDNRFSLNADPIIPGWTGVRYFYMDESGVLRTRVGGPAGSTDPPALAL